MSVSGQGLNNIQQSFVHVLFAELNIPMGVDMKQFYYIGKPVVNTLMLVTSLKNKQTKPTIILKCEYRNACFFPLSYCNCYLVI